MSERVAVMRLQKDFQRLVKDPVPYVIAAPKPSNILEWFFLVRGPEGTPYEGGFYLGRLIFPVDYPFKPPSIMVITPSGRFAPNQRLCLSNSDFHPETWNPAWNVGTILCGLVSFMTGDQSTVGSIKSSDLEKRVFARGSVTWCLNNATFRQLFPTFIPELEKLHQDAITMSIPEPDLAPAKNTTPSTAEKPNVERDWNRGHEGRRNIFSGKLLRILFVAGLAAFAVAVRAFTHSIST